MADVVPQDHQVKKLKNLLEGWRMLLLPLKSILLWEQQWHPCAIVGALSVLHLLIWLMDLNFITTFAVVGLIFNLIDFLVPIVCNAVYGPNSWNGQKEKVFEEICRSIAAGFNKTMQRISSFYAMRESSTIIYYVISISTLLLLMWLSSTINNIFLLYILSTVMLLWPGIQQKGFLKPVLAMIHAPKKD